MKYFIIFSDLTGSFHQGLKNITVLFIFSLQKISSKICLCYIFSFIRSKIKWTRITEVCLNNQICTEIIPEIWRSKTQTLKVINNNWSVYMFWKTTLLTLIILLLKITIRIKYTFLFERLKLEIESRLSWVGDNQELFMNCYVKIFTFVRCCLMPDHFTLPYLL